MHPNNDIVATGQLGKDPKIVVWKSSTQEVLKYDIMGQNMGVQLTLRQGSGALS